jgi:hypothetical protein
MLFPMLNCLLLLFCHLHVPIVLKSGSLNLLEPSGPVKACNGIALPFTLRDIEHGGLAVACTDTFGSLTGNCCWFLFVASVSSGAVIVVALRFHRAIGFSCVQKRGLIWFLLKDGLFSYLFSQVSFSRVLATVLFWIFTKKCSKFEIGYWNTMCLNNPKTLRNGPVFVRHFWS